MSRAFLLVLDSVGIGGAPDGAKFGDAGADTLGHIARECAAGRGDRAGLRSGPLRLPNLERMGLGFAARNAAGEIPAGFDPGIGPQGVYASAIEISQGKDTPSGHWEIAGVPVPFEWGYFPKSEPCFPPGLTDAIIAGAALPGILGNKHASGTDIIAELGEEHIRTGKPILYTSADSVLQIAAHETRFGLERLYRLCETARAVLDRMMPEAVVGRVIARPFLGETRDSFERTGNRKDYAVPPPEPTLMDRLKSAGRKVIAVGKIDDIFAHRGATHVRKANGNAAMAQATLEAMAQLADGGLIFANFVDFDQLYAHRRDVAGYAASLEAFDALIPQFTTAMREGDLLVITADHGNDPTWTGTDHTREQVPVLFFRHGIVPANAGTRQTFADIGETVAAHLGLAPGRHGKPVTEALA